MVTLWWKCGCCTFEHVTKEEKARICLMAKQYNCQRCDIDRSRYTPRKDPVDKTK